MLSCTRVCCISLEIHKLPVACVGDTPTTNVISCESGSQISILDMVFGVDAPSCPSNECCINSSVCEAPARYLDQTYLNQTEAECDGRGWCGVPQPGVKNLTCHTLTVRRSQYIIAKYICQTNGKSLNVCCLILLITILSVRQHICNRM